VGRRFESIEPARMETTSPERSIKACLSTITRI
jgi:hypothetical protein